jgi:3' terminal RNA ribose 2'-O-methyltransferase Hen1
VETAEVLLTLSTTMPDATDLGFLLHKHPDRAQSFEVSGGTAHVVWPEADAARSTVALLLEVDPIALVRSKGNRGADGFALSQYVNDKPYSASSMLAVALGKVFRTAMTGRCDARPELAQQAVALEVHIPALPSRDGVDLIQRLFTPLGWAVTVTPIALDPQIPAWGDSAFVDLHLSGMVRVADALTQLYVLMPVLDDRKHYWISADEVDKLMRAGSGWLAEHPERDLITRRYLGHHHTLIAGAVARLAEVDDVEPETLDNAVADNPDERPTLLAELRRKAVVAQLRAEGASTVVDLGCGEGALLRELVPDPSFAKVLGVEVSARALQLAERRLNLDRLPDSQRDRLQLIQSSAVYRDERLAGYDAVVLMEVIEHIDPPRLPALERAVFGHANPRSVLVTTPNVEFNVRYESLPAGRLRHRDHRFEWTRAEFAAWAETTAAAYGYAVRYVPIGDEDTEVGSPTQLAVFRKVGT